MDVTLHHHRFRTRSIWNIVRGLACAVLALCLTLGFVSPSLAQKSDRRVVSTTKPDYPKFLKGAGIGGLVRLRATVLPNGTVTAVDIVGGNPILAEKAAAALMKWKFAPAASQTTEFVSLNFDPRNI
jgi:TonB family protein